MVSPAMLTAVYIAFQIKILGALPVGDGRQRPIPSLLPSQNHYLKSDPGRAKHDRFTIPPQKDETFFYSSALQLFQNSAWSLQVCRMLSNAVTTRFKIPVGYFE